MHFVLQSPSLQHLAAVKIVTHLWHQKDIFIQIAESFNGRAVDQLREDEQKWKAIEDKVEGNVSALPLPELHRKKQLVFLIKPIGSEIKAWCRYHNVDSYSFHFLDSWLPKQLLWTMHGTVDYAKTAELIVEDESLDVGRRYKIASLNCLEEEARELIEHLPKMLRRRKFKNVTSYLGSLALSSSCNLRNDYTNMDQFRASISQSYFKYLFKKMLYGGSRGTCQYLYEKLSQDEKEQVFVENPMRSFRLDVDFESPTCALMYYLSLMNEKHQESMFRECINALLIVLLRWPLQTLFMEAAKRGWQFMSKQNCVQVLYAIITKMQNGFRDYDYAQLFWAGWSLSPVEYKQAFLNDIYHLDGLFASKEEKLIQLVLNQAPSYRLKKFVGYSYNESGQELMDDSVISDAALKECEQTALLNSLKDKEDEEKRLRSEYLTRLVDIEVERRIKRRRL